MGSMQKLLAELFGTFTLVFVGSVAIVGAGASDVRLVSIALGFGLALLIGLYAFGEVSGGHFNPVVSLAMFLDKRLPAGDLIGYWVAQFAGGHPRVTRRAHSVGQRHGRRHGHGEQRHVARIRHRSRFHRALPGDHPPGHAERQVRTERAHGNSAGARCDSRRSDPDQRRLGQPGSKLRACAGRHRVRRPLALLRCAGDRCSPGLDRPQGRRHGGHEPS